MKTSNLTELWAESWLDAANQSYLEDRYEELLASNSRAKGWDGVLDAKDTPHGPVRQQFTDYKPRHGTHIALDSSAVVKQAAVARLIFNYRLLGHQIAKTNPLTIPDNIQIPELQLSFHDLSDSDLATTFACEGIYGKTERTLAEIIKVLEHIYCGPVGFEYLHISDSTEREWLSANIEQVMQSLELDSAKRMYILELLTASDGLEKYLGAKYPGAKRFSLEGCDSLVVALDEIITNATAEGAQEVVLAMTHRGRLNLLVNLMGKMPSELFAQFEDTLQYDLEAGDVKYHQGFSSDLQTPSGPVHMAMAFNPSHLEIVCPVACGSVRARQDRRKDKVGNQVLCISMHGDAAFAGQGVVMETLNMSATPAYSIGGTVHIIVNNQIGFTTSEPNEARSTMYCSDIGKMLSVPIFHVNADDPEAVAASAKLALAYRNKFHKDVILDIVGYRRMGHNEADEPAVTQPLMYKQIRAHPSVREIYANYLIKQGVCDKDTQEKLLEDYRQSLELKDQAVVKRLAVNWKNIYASDWTTFDTNDWRSPANTKVKLDTLIDLANKRDAVPDGFSLDRRVAKIIAARRNMTETEQQLDWGYAETLAYASLVAEGYSVRISGQDCERGTFFHRHAVWHDFNTGAKYCSLQHIHAEQADFEIYNSTLSEAAVLAFEYGYSSSEPRGLTVWEAQFGDFANGAQVVIDQFISSAETKWGRLSGIVLLLPHGYEGQGPEHSSARIERYLQLCAQHNMQVCIPSTPAQMFHLLRRQLLRAMRKPLIVMTPKSLLRHKLAISTLQEFAEGEFQAIIADTDVDNDAVESLILCSGKVYYELIQARSEVMRSKTAIVRIEQLHPFPEQELEALLARYTKLRDIVWCQEEPKNQGAWYSTQHHLRNALSDSQTLRYAGRADSAAPAVGYSSLHAKQQKELIEQAFGVNNEH